MGEFPRLLRLITNGGETAEDELEDQLEDWMRDAKG